MKESQENKQEQSKLNHTSSKKNIQRQLFTSARENQSRSSQIQAQQQQQSEKTQSIEYIDRDALQYEVDRSLFYARTSKDPKEYQRFQKRAEYFQAKLNVSHPQDEQELEADRVAEQVMRMQDINVEKSNSADYIPRREQPGRLTPGRTTPSIPLHIETRILRERDSGGAPLSDSSKDFFEPRFNADLSNIRIHNNSESNDLSKNINAKAFAMGNDIFFAPGQYDEQSSEGKKLMAHELTHTIQQKGKVGRKIQRDDSDNPYEPGNAVNNEYASGEKYKLYDFDLVYNKISRSLVLKIDQNLLQQDYIVKKESNYFKIILMNTNIEEEISNQKTNYQYTFSYNSKETGGITKILACSDAGNTYIYVYTTSEIFKEYNEGNFTAYLPITSHKSQSYKENIADFKQAVKEEALKRLKMNKEYIREKVAAYDKRKSKNKSERAEKWKGLNKAIETDKELSKEIENLIRLKTYINMHNTFKEPNSALVRQYGEDFWYDPKYINKFIQKHNLNIAAKKNTFDGRVKMDIQANGLIKKLRQKKAVLRTVYPTLNFLNTKDITPNSTNEKKFHKIKTGMNSFLEKVAEVEEKIKNDEISFYKLTPVIRHVLKSKGLDKGSLNKFGKDASYYVSQKESREETIKLVTTIGTIVFSIAGLVTTGGAATILALAGATAGLGSSIYKFNLANEAYDLAKAGEHGKHKLTDKNPKEAALDYSWAIIDLAFSAIDMGLAVKGVSSLLKATQVVKAVKTAKSVKLLKNLLSKKAFEILSKKLGKRLAKRLLRKVGNEALPGFAKLDSKLLSEIVKLGNKQLVVFSKTLNGLIKNIGRVKTLKLMHKFGIELILVLRKFTLHKVLNGMKQFRSFENTMKIMDTFDEISDAYRFFQNINFKKIKIIGNKSNLTLKRLEKIAVLERSKLVRKFRNRGNIGIAESIIDGKIELYKSHSGIGSKTKKEGWVSMVENNSFKTIKIADYNRVVDTEAKIIEVINKRISVRSKGIINLYTERYPCDSCLFVLKQFTQKYPNIGVKIYTSNF